MNIWMLNHYATPPDTPGITRHYDFARELIKHGHAVTIFTSSFEHRTRRNERIGKKQSYRIENIDGVEFAWLRTYPYYGGNDWRRAMNMLSYTFRVIPLGLKLKEKPDVILASSPHPFAGLAGWILAKQKRAVFIFEVRDLWPQALIDVGGYSSKSYVVKLLRMLEGFLYRRATKIVALGSVISEYIMNMGITCDKIVLIPNGINPELFESSNTELPESLAQLISQLRAAGKRLVGYAGAHGIANSLDTIVAAGELLQQKGANNIHILLVGDGPEKDKLIAQSKKLQLRNIDFYMPIPKNSMPALLNNLDVTVITLTKAALSIYGSPNKLYEYMISAKPVVWTIDSPNNPVDKAGCGITIPPEDPQAMVDAIMQLCDMSKDERHLMGMRGNEYVLKYHSTPILAQKLLEVIERTRLE